MLVPTHRCISVLAAVGHTADAINGLIFALGRPVVADSHVVREHMQDHPDIYVEYEVRQPTYSSALRGINLIRAGLQFLLRGDGPATSPGTHVLGYLKSDPGEPEPDLLFFGGPWSRIEDGGTFASRKAVMSMSPSLCGPRSRGRISLRSANPTDPPRVQANMLADADADADDATFTRRP